MARIVKKITLRDLYRNAGKIAREVAQGVVFDVYVHGKKSFNISPIENLKPAKHKRNMHELFSKLMFKSKKAGLSKKIDQVVYGER